MGNNGKGPIPFAVKEHVPIIGQPMTVISWFPTVSITCNCEARQPLLLIGIGNLSVCPKCGRGFQLFGISQPDVRQHQRPPHLDINIVAASVLQAAAAGADEDEDRKPS